MWSIINNVNFILSGDASKLRSEYENLLASTAQINEFIGQMVMMLHKRDSLSDEELGQLIQYFTQLASPNLNLALLTARRNKNPLTPEEADRLENFINKANQGHYFSPSDIGAYSELVEKAKREQQTEANPWPLIALGAFLLGLLLASQAKK